MTKIANQDLAKVLSRANECLRRLIEAGLSYDDLQIPIDNPDARARLVACWKNLPKSLKLISGKEKIMIEALDGQATIANAKDTFKSYLDANFENWGLNTSGPATPETLLDVHEMIEDANFTQIFTGLNTDLDKLVLTQAQIIRFCAKHPTWLRQEGHATFFLIKKDMSKPAIADNLFVVSVHVDSDGLRVSVHRFERARVWDAGYRHRLVVPQLNTSAI